MEKKMRKKTTANMKKKIPARSGEKVGKAKKLINLENIYCQSADVVARMIEGELILVPLVAGIGSVENEIYALDETGKEIWARLDGHKNVAEIAADLENTYQSSSRSIKNDIIGLMEELAKRGLIWVVAP